ncbi:MAG: 30S ribosomal protein S6 [Pirellulales bacterium]
MAAQFYECLFIFDSNRYARDPGGVSESVTEAIVALGGEILVSRLWAEQRLAYPIDGHQKGTYWLTYFKLDSLRLKELNRAFQLSEPIVRFQVLKVDPRLVDALVAHAQGKQFQGSTDGRVAIPVGTNVEVEVDETEDDEE